MKKETLFKFTFIAICFLSVTALGSKESLAQSNNNVVGTTFRLTCVTGQGAQLFLRSLSAKARAKGFRASFRLKKTFISPTEKVKVNSDTLQSVFSVIFADNIRDGDISIDPSNIAAQKPCEARYDILTTYRSGSENATNKKIGTLKVSGTYY